MRFFGYDHDTTGKLLLIFLLNFIIYNFIARYCCGDWFFVFFSLISVYNKCHNKFSLIKWDAIRPFISTDSHSSQGRARGSVLKNKFIIRYIENVNFRFYISPWKARWILCAVSQLIDSILLPTRSPCANRCRWIRNRLMQLTIAGCIF